MGPALGLVQPVLRPSLHDGAAEIYESIENFLQRKPARVSVDDDRRVGPVGLFKRSIFEQPIEHDLRLGAPLQLDHDAEPFPVRFVPNVGNSLDRTVLRLVGYSLDYRRFLYLKGNLGNYDVVPFDLRLGPHPDPALPRPVSLFYPFPAEDDRSGREIRPLDVFHQFVQRGLRVVYQVDQTFDQLGEIVRRNLCRHPDGNSPGAVQK